MKKFPQNLIVIFSILLLFSHSTIINGFPCPPECICKASDTTDDDFTRMTYNIDCTNARFNKNQLIYQAQAWSILEDKIEEDDGTNDYTISIDLSNIPLLKQFNNKTIQLTGFSFSIHSLSLTNQSKQFLLESNAFNSNLYENLQVLNLSSCCQQIPIQCPQLFRPLKKLEILDLSGSNMYKTCLNTSGTISSTLRDLILRDNNYDTNTFSHSSQFFTGVRGITGRLDLRNSRFNMSTQLYGNCLFDLFTNITILDLSSVQFDSISNSIEIHLKHLLKCKGNSQNDYQGKQLLELYLRQLNLQSLPEWFTNDRFPQLTRLDLANNHIYSVDIRTFTKLTSISLAYNPIEFHRVIWRSNLTYESINLRSTTVHRTFNLQTRMENLFQISTNIDYSENTGNLRFNLTKFPIALDFSNEVSLNLSRTNISSFEIQEMSRFDDLYRLDISFNHLTVLNLGKQSKLSYLDCSHQNLRTLILNNENSNLIELKCSNNSLKTIENFLLDKHERIQSIDLSYNQLKTIFTLSNNRYFRTLNLKSNLIEKLPSNIFHNKLLSLYSIDLSWNRINLIEKNAFQSPNLQILDLTGNPLKFIESNFLLTPSLRLFDLFNTTEDLSRRCAQSTKTDQLLLTYLTWFEQNGTYMKNIREIQVEKCLRSYQSRSKTKWTRFNNDHHMKHLALYMTTGAILLGILLGGIYFYRKNQFSFFTNFKHYRLLDRNSSREPTDDINQHQCEDDEIVMNLDEPPFRPTNRRLN